MRKKKVKKADQIQTDMEPQITAREEAGQDADKPKKHTGVFLRCLIWLLLSLLPMLTFAAEYMALGKDRSGMGRQIVQLACFGVVFFFVLMLCDKKHIWLFDNEENIKRFALAFIAGDLLMAASVFLDPMLWLFLPLAAAMLLCGHIPQAGCGYLLILYALFLLSGVDTGVFMAYALIGILGIMLFCFLDDEFLFGLPMLLALLFQTVLLVIMDVSVTGRLGLAGILYALIQLIIGFVCLTFLLKYISAGMIHKRSDKYSEINDPEYVLLSQLREKNQRAYYHAIHTAHFCEQLAERIGADRELCKAGGYYHKIGKMRGESNLKNALDIAEEYDFPAELRELLMEYGGKNKKLRSKEAAIVLLSDAMVSSVMFLYEKNKDAKLSFSQIAQVVFDKQLESGYLDECLLTMDEFTTIKNCFAQEKLYYDFLR